MRCFCSVVLLAIVLLFGRSVSAEVIDYQQVIQTSSELIHHYTFDGGSTERLQDRRGSADLVAVVRGAEGVPISFGAGFAASGSGSTSTAVTTTRHSTNANHGGALTTSDAASSDFLSLPATLTVETLFRPDAAALAAGTNTAYIVSSRPSAAVRGYFLLQGEATPDTSSRLFANIGAYGTDNQLDLANPLFPGHWYYTATTFAVDEVNNTTTITGYIADLTGGDTALTPLGSKTVSGDYLGDSPLSIGMLSYEAYSGGYDHFFPGAIDEVALYGAVLDQATLQLHLDSILVPEPSVFALLAAGLLGFLALGRTKRS